MSEASPTVRQNSDSPTDSNPERRSQASHIPPSPSSSYSPPHHGQQQQQHTQPQQQTRIHQQQQQSQHQQMHSLSTTSHTSQNNSQQFCLRWNNYQTNLTSVFDQLLQNESFVDVTLACDSKSIKAHKIVLSACSPYFQSLFIDNPCQHPVIIMRDVKWPELKAAVEFMYKGEINVSQEQIGPLLRVAEMLKIRGLADVNGEQELNTKEQTCSMPANLSSIPRSPSNSPRERVEVPASPSWSTSASSKKQRINPPHREWDMMVAATAAAAAAATNNLETVEMNATMQNQRHRKRQWPSTENNSPRSSSPMRTATPDRIDLYSPIPLNSGSGTSSISHPPTTPIPILPFSIPPQLEAMELTSLAHNDDIEIKPGIAEMIREEERVSNVIC